MSETAFHVVRDDLSELYSFYDDEYRPVYTPGADLVPITPPGVPGPNVMLAGLFWASTDEWWFRVMGGLGISGDKPWPSWDAGQRFVQVSYELEDVYPGSGSLPGEIRLTACHVDEEVFPT